MAISDLFRRKEDHEPTDPSGDRALTFPTKALPRFLSTLKSREQPILLDLGPVVGQNVTFFGERLGCKIFVEDIFGDVERHVRQQTVSALPLFFAGRFPQADGTVDGILCWDVFDYLERPAAQALAAQLTRILRPGGALLALFGTVAPQPGRASYTKRTVVDETTLRHRDWPASRDKQPPELNRDTTRLFEPLTVSEQFLLKTNVREVLFRKPAA